MGSKSLYQSILKKSYRDIKFWLEEQKVDINKPHDEEPAMHAAAKLGDPEFARYIHECGGSLDVLNHAGCTPLFMSLVLKYRETAMFFIKAGCSINIAGPHDTTPFMVACWHRDLEVCRLLIAHGADVKKSHSSLGNALHFASNSGHIEIVSLLLENGANINEQAGENESTPLGKAIHGKSYEVARYLLDRGANVETVFKLGFRALHLAVASKKPELIILLLNRGANINCQDDLGNTPLHMAASDKNKEAYQILVKKNADQTIRNLFGELPIYKYSPRRRLLRK